MHRARRHNLHDILRRPTLRALGRPATVGFESSSGPTFRLSAVRASSVIVTTTVSG